MSESPLYADYRRGDGFVAPWEPFPARYRDLLRWRFSRNPFDKSRPPHLPVVPNDGASLRQVAATPRLTWIGHATFAIHDGADVVLTDPHFGPRALVPPRWTPPGVPLAAVPEDALAVLSHSHYDHLDSWTVRRLPETVEWFVPLGLAAWFRRRGRRATELGWWQSVRHGRWTLTCLPAQHWSRRLGHGINRTLWCSWLLECDGRRYYFAGDSGYFEGYRELGRRFPGIDVALLPIGSYEPRWFMRYQHMNPAEAYRAFQELGARYMLPMHWGTFDLTDEPLDLPPEAFREEVRRAGGDPCRSPVLAVGESWQLPPGEG